MGSADALPAMSDQVWKCIVSVGPMLIRIRSTSTLVARCASGVKAVAALLDGGHVERRPCWQSPEMASPASGRHRFGGSP